MKITQYYNTEKYINLMRECIVCAADYLKLRCEKARCIEIPRLNIIIRENIDPKLFLRICLEYRFHRNTLTQWIARIYIYLIYVHLLFRAPLFLHNKSTFMMPFGYVAAMGGNNRVRLIDAMNAFALLIPSDAANSFFILNILSAYKPENRFPLNLMPKIFAFSDRLYFEQQVEGIAINRLRLSKIQQKFINDEMNHYFACQSESSYAVDINSFLSSRVEILLRYGALKDDLFYSMFVDLCSDVKKFVENLNITTYVQVSPSHGDLNLGNILYSTNRIFIIDWEYCYDRYMEYDRIVYSYNLRHLSTEDYVDFVENTSLDDINVLIFLIEDILFRFINYKKDLINSNQYINCIVDLIKSKIVVV